MPARMIPDALPPRDALGQQECGRALLAELATRRTCRDFAPAPVDCRMNEAPVAVAQQAPSGALRRRVLPSRRHRPRLRCRNVFQCRETAG